jgi:hypothetical protein
MGAGWGASVDGVAQRARLDQVVAGLDRLAGGIEQWLRIRGERDTLRQYATPLATLERTLLGATRALRAEARAVGTARPLWLVHAGCKDLERRAALVRKLWAWFAEKFDQRDDTALRELLAAADEVVWSCYREAFDSAELSGAPVAERGPTPLPYVDPGGVVEAFVRDEPPPGLGASEDDQALGSFLATLPVPVIAVPVGWLDAPWWLALLAHEVGHHVQYDLVPRAALVAEVGQRIAAAVGDGPATSARWRLWSREIFADACALASVGAGAITALLQLELDTEERLLDGGRGRYPAAVVRLALVVELAERLGIDGRSALAGFDPWALAAPRGAGGDGSADPLEPQRAAARADLALVGKVAEAVLAAPLGGAGPLDGLFRFSAADHEPGGRVAGWADAVGRGDARPDTTLRAPRDQVGGAVLAWLRLSAIADDRRREEALAGLARSLPPLVIASRKPGTRSGGRERGPVDVSAELTELLRATTRRDRERVG